MQPNDTSRDVLDDDEDLDWDEWMTLTDEQQEAIVEREMREHGRWYEALPLGGKIAYGRMTALDSCRRARRTLRLPHVPEIIAESIRESLRNAQMRLVKVRVWRATGVYPGEA